MSQWRHARPCHLCSCCGSGTFRNHRHRSSARPRRHLRVDGRSDPHRPWSHHSVGVQPVKAATARNDRGESQPRVVWGIRRGLVPASVLFGVERSGVAVGTVIALGSGPMFSGLIDLALHRRHPAMKWYTGTAVMLVGVAVLVAGGANDSSEISLSLFGMLSAMAAGLGYAVYAHTTSVLISQV